MNTYIRTHTLNLIYKHKYTHIHTHMHIYIYTHTHKYIHTSKHTHADTNTHKHTHNNYIHTSKHTRRHTHIHTHTYTRKYTSPNMHTFMCILRAKKIRFPLLPSSLFFGLHSRAADKYDLVLLNKPRLNNLHLLITFA